MNSDNNTTKTPVEAIDLMKFYRSGNNTVRALNGVTLTIPYGEFVVIMGASGSGKSTLLHVLSGLTEPTAGSVCIQGVNLANMKDAEKTRFRRKHVGIVFQAFNLIPTLTAEENILLPSQLEGGNMASKEKLNELLDLLEIQDRRKHRPDSLSGGEQQRVAIARALMMEPAIIFADEPTGNLDSENSQRLCQTLRTLRDQQQRTILVVSHESAVADWADRRIVLKDGKISDETLVERKEAV